MNIFCKVELELRVLDFPFVIKLHLAKIVV